MKKRIVLLIICVLVIAQTATILVAVGSFRSTYQAEVRESLKGDINAIELSMDGPGDYQALADKYGTAYGQDMRVTFIGLDGTVQADSAADAQTLENHIDRPEIADALAGGFGTAVRTSDSTGVETLYVAKQTDDGVILRMAMPLAQTQIFVNHALPVMIVMFVVILIVALVFSGRLAKNILSPMNQLCESIRGYMEGEAAELRVQSKYEELADISQAFTDISKRLNRYIRRVKQENQKSTLILNSIGEGLMILDADQDVLLINEAARRIFGASEDISNVNILHFVRRQEILNQLDYSFKKRKNMTFDMRDEVSGKTYRYMTSIVSEEAFVKNGDGMLVLVTDVTDIVRSEQVRRDFAANVSHELKTPLTSIDGYAQLIANGMVKDSDEARVFAGRITDEADRLMGLINDTLQLSELEQIAIDEKIERVELECAVRDVQGLLAQKLEKQGVTMEVEGTASTVANRNRLKELILNLCDNAIKYNRPGGHVKVAVSEDKNEAQIIVSDTGIGIPEEETERIFERFYRAKNAGGATVPGTGLGLAIAKHIAGLYGGEVAVESVLGQGSTFTVRLKKK